MSKALAEIKSLLADNKFPLLGIAGSDRMEDAPEGHRPSDLLPGAKSVIAVGLPVPKGAYQCKGREIETVWRTHTLYYRNIDAAMLKLSLLLEKQGDMAVPVFSCFPFAVKGLGDLWGFGSLIKMAEAAGLGKTGRNSLLFNSTYGPRLILGGVVTSAALPAGTWPDKDEGGCPQGCHTCQDSCPPKAIDIEGRVDTLACVKYSSKTPIFSHLLKYEKYHPDELQKINLTTTADDNNINTCMECVSACPYLLA